MILNYVSFSFPSPLKTGRAGKLPIGDDEKTRNHGNNQDANNEKQDSEQTRENGDNADTDVIQTLEELQAELTDTKTDWKLERAIQVIAEANGTIRVLESRVMNLMQEKETESQRVDMAKQEAAACMVQLEVVRRGREHERTRQADHLVKWEAQQKDRLNIIDQKESKLRSKENNLKRREDDVKQHLQTIKKQQVDIERRTKDLLRKTEAQEKREEDLNAREDRTRQKERLLLRREGDVGVREDDATKQEENLSKLEVKLKRREIESKRLEEQLKIMQEVLRREEQDVRIREEDNKMKEATQGNQDEVLKKREDTMRDKERRLKARMGDMRHKEEELRLKDDDLKEKQKAVDQKEDEQKNAETDITQRTMDVEGREKDVDEREERLEAAEDDISRRAKDLALREEQCHNLQEILNLRSAEQEKIDRTLKMMELEQRRMELEQIRREQGLIVKEQEQMESDRLNETMSQKNLEEWKEKLDAVEKRSEELQQREELLGRVELEQKMRDLEYTINDAEDGDDFEDSGIMEQPMSSLSDAMTVDEEEEDIREYGINMINLKTTRSAVKPYLNVRVAAPHVVSTLKTILASEEGIPASWQRLYIKNSNRALEDGCELPQSEVRGEMELDMKLAIPSGGSKRSMPVRTSNGLANIIEFDTTETVACAKVRVFKHTGIPPHQQILVNREKVLEDQYTIESFNLKKNAQIQLRLRMRISVQISRVDIIPITIEEIDTLGRLKELISDKTQLPIESMRLYYNTRELSDHETILHYGLTEEKLLQVVHEITFAIRPGTDTVTVEIDPGATARQLKAVLRRKNLCVERPTIIAGDHVLNDNQTIMDALCNVETFEIHSGNVLVVLDTGEIIRNGRVKKGSLSKISR